MPWTAADATKHVKGLSTHQRTVWSRTANSALRRCEADGDKDCDARAIRQANAVAQQAPKEARESAREAVLDAIHESEILRLSEAERSYDAIRRALERAISDARPEGEWNYLVETFEDFCIEGAGGRFYKRSYTLNLDDGTAALGARVEVTPRTEYDEIENESPLQEAAIAGEFIPLSEAAADGNGAVSSGRIKLIAPGWGASGYYPAKVLERDGPKVFRKGTKMYWNHPTAAEEAARPEGDLNNLAGELTSNAKWEANGPAGAGLYADNDFLQEKYRNTVRELAPHIGTSIRGRALGRVGEADGQTGNIIDQILAAKSVDFITEPGAGGKIIELFEAARGTTATAPPPQETVMDDKELKELREANTKLSEQVTAQARDLAGMRERGILTEATALVDQSLREARLPDLSRDSLRERLLANPPVKDGQLDRTVFATTITEAVKSKRAEIAAITGVGQVRDLGSGTTGTADPPTVEASTAALMGSFKRMGLSEAAAKVAAEGRAI